MPEDAPEGDVIDPIVLENLRGLNEPGGPDVFVEILDLYLRDAPPRVEAVRRFAEDGDPDGVARAAHALKGSSQNVGARRLAAAAAALEERGRDRDLGDFESLVRRLEAEFAIARSVLEAEKKR